MSAPAYLSLNYFDQSVYLNIQTIIANLQQYTQQGISETRHELGLSGFAFNSEALAYGGPSLNTVQSYIGWAIANGAPKNPVGSGLNSWNWYLKNKILGGQTPLNQGPVLSCHMAGRFHHKKRVCTQTGTITPSTSNGGPYPKIGSLSAITNNINLTAQNLQTELNRIHLPMPTNFNAWTNVIANYAATSLEGVGLVNLFNTLNQFASWLKQISVTVAAKKQADLVAQQQYQAAQQAAAIAQQTAQQAAQTVATQTEQAASQAKTIATAQTSAMQTAEQQLQQAKTAAQLSTQAAQAAATHLANGNTAASQTAAQVSQVAAIAAQTLSQASNAVQVASVNPTPQNVATATVASAAAKTAVSSVNSATAKKSSVLPWLLVGGAVIAKAAGLAL